jgi:tripartite-type tricarboxylate transporter receptor subunit TctC
MRSICKITSCLVQIWISAALAQPYPEKPVRLVVGFSAGGPTDLPARYIADRLGAALGQRVIVENRTGAGGQIATQEVLSKPRDGYNLLLCTHFEGINLAIYKNAAYTLADIAPITQIARYYYAAALANSVPAQSWEEFVAHAKANPGKLNYGMTGRGSAQEILALELGKLTGIEMTGIAYKGGADVMNDLIPGRLHFYVSPTLGVLPHYKAGRLRLIAVTSPERLAAAPDIPTLAEKGLPFVRYGWLGVCAGAGTPTPIVDLLQRQIATIVGSPDYRNMIEKAGSIAVSSTPDEFQQVITQTLDDVAASIREFGLQQD